MNSAAHHAHRELLLPWDVSANALLAFGGWHADTLPSDTHPGRQAMQPIVAVIAPGMMGSGVGQRLVENGIEVRTALAGRSEATVARAKAAGMIGVSDEQIAASDIILSIVPPGDALGLAERLAPALRAAAEKADLRRLQCARPRHRAAHRPRGRGNRRDVRRWRHHRRAAEAGIERHPDLPVRRGGAAGRGAGTIWSATCRCSRGRSVRPRR